MGDIGMIKRGGLAWLLWQEGLVFRGVVGDVVVLRSCVCLGGYVDVRGYRERRGGRNR
jgi:hypothetical protein